MVGVVGGEQVLNMGPGCEYVGLVLHEFGHAIGYFHEHNRPDRDDTVKILWENIQSGKGERTGTGTAGGGGGANFCDAFRASTVKTKDEKQRQIYRLYSGMVA